METTIKLSNGKIFNLLENNFTSQDYKELSSVEIKKVRSLQEELVMEKIIESFDCSMDSPCSEKEWEDYEKQVKEAEELAKKGIFVDYS